MYQQVHLNDLMTNLQTEPGKESRSKRRREEVKEELQFSSASVANVSLLSAELKIFENAEEKRKIHLKLYWRAT
ncbi:MAG: hypothetical protein IPK55_15160 [Streptococcus sp.]|nr:hypothetical protein [Streptococcus sp.]